MIPGQIDIYSQVSSLRRLVMGTDILDLQILELNMLNANKERTPIDVRRGSGWRKSRRTCQNHLYSRHANILQAGIPRKDRL